MDNQLRYARRYLKICRKHVSLGKLIDVGSSTNPFPNLASEAGFEVTVMDFTRPQCLTEGVAWVEASLNDNRILMQYQERFDVVSAWAVLEHVVDPKLAVKTLAGLCCNGGTILLSTPEIGTFLTRHARGHSCWFSPPSHLHLFSAAAMIQLFTAEGCVLIRQGRIELNSARWLARYGVGIAEAIVGLFLRYVFSRKWYTMRRDHTQKFKGIKFFVFKKVS
ncbi:MAG: class I SAM-dependent methyltransferase [Deltaproteobacteria bacterium]|nr:class I SAM-dependent methyltransferase [Deltaproteobacteria bacterium]